MASLVCLSCDSRKSADEVQDVFDEVGLELNLATLLDEHFQLHVVREEKKPKPICFECLEKLTQCIDAEAYAMQQLENDEVSEETHKKLNAKEAEQESSSVAENQNFRLQFMQSDTDGDVYVLLPDTDVDESMKLQDEYELSQHSELSDFGESMELIFNEIRDTDHDLEVLSKYLDSCINNDLEAININVALACEQCSKEFDNYRDSLEHLVEYHKEGLGEAQHFVCTLKNCQKNFSEVKTLARHILLSHCEVHGLQIIGECIHCHFRFTNFIDFNKHTCYQKNFNLKNRLQCQHCRKMFVSTKRCKFHAQFHLPERRQMLCFVCEQTFDDDVELFEHVNYQHRPVPPHTCTVCDITFKKELAFVSHRVGCKEKNTSSTNHKKPLSKDIQNSNESNFQCLECWMTFESPVRCGNHKKKHQVDGRLGVYVCNDCGVVAPDVEDIQSKFVGNCEHAIIKSEILSVVLTCRNCALEFRTIKQYMAHLLFSTHDSRTYKCPECDEVFNDEKSIRSHVKAEHKNYEQRFDTLPIKRLFTCALNKCEETFDQWLDYQKHKCVVHKMRMCKHCQLEVTADEFSAHKKSCRDTKTHTCQYCGLEYKSKMSCAVHIARSHNAKQSSVCGFCKAIFKTEESMQAHVNYMHVPIKCTECHKVIKNQRNYDVHVRAVHQKVQRYFCSHCNKGFYYKSECVAHEKNLHSGSLHKCSKCSFATHYAESLEVHMAVHINKLTLKCPHCSKRFVRKNSLDIHVKGHTNEKRFVCSERLDDGCEKAFISNYLLVKHIKKWHSNEDSSIKESLVKLKRKRVSKEKSSDEIKDTTHQPRRVSLRKKRKS